MTPQQQALIDWLAPKKDKGTNTATRTIIGEALTDSASGEVMAAFATDISDGAANEFREVTNQISLPTTVDCRKGDKIVISLYGNDVFKKPTVTGVAGGGDRTQREVAAAQQAADNAGIVAADAATTAAAAAEGAEAAAEAAAIANNAAAEAQGAAEQADDAAEMAADAAAEAQRVADAAAAAAEATGQYFFHDTNGAHVSTTQDDATTGPNLLLNTLGTFMRDGTDVQSSHTATGFSVFDSGALAAHFGATSQVGKSTSKNMIMDGNGILLRDSSNYLLALMGLGLTVYDGQGNNASNQYAHFGATSFIGKSTSGSYNLVLDAAGILQRIGTNYLTTQTSSGFTVYDGQGNATGNQLAHFGATSFIGNDSSGYQLVMDQDQLDIIDHAADPWDMRTDKSVFHVGTANNTLYFSLGSRAYSGASHAGPGQHTSTIGDRSASIGYYNSVGTMFSSAIGYDNAVSGGTYATAIGRGNGIEGGTAPAVIGQGLHVPSNATREGQVVVGQYNADDTTAQFIVGGGSSTSNKKNVLSVYEDEVKTNRGNILSQNLLWSGKSADVITLNDSLEGYDYVEIFFCTDDTEPIYDSMKVYWGDSHNPIVVNLCTSMVWSANGASVKASPFILQNTTSLYTYETVGELRPYFTTTQSYTVRRGQILFDANNRGTVSNGTYIYITRVIGYRK